MRVRSNRLDQQGNCSDRFAVYKRNKADGQRGRVQARFKMLSGDIAQRRAREEVLILCLEP